VEGGGEAGCVPLCRHRLHNTTGGFIKGIYGIRIGPQFYFVVVLFGSPPLCQLRPQGADSLPLPLRVAKTGKNLLKEEITTPPPPSPLG
jgi:hypothetical protein